MSGNNEDPVKELKEMRKMIGSLNYRIGTKIRGKSDDVPDLKRLELRIKRLLEQRDASKLASLAAQKQQLKLEQAKLELEQEKLKSKHEKLKLEQELEDVKIQNTTYKELLLKHKIFMLDHADSDSD